MIGGSGAGVMSAVAAAREGAKVVLVSKGKVGKNGNAIMLGGSFGVDGQGARDVCGEADANQEYTAESLFHKMVACGFGLGDQELQKQFVEEGPEAVRELLQWVKECGSTFVFSPKACRWRAGGVAFGNALRHGLDSHREIAAYEDTIISDLLTSDGKVCGAVGFEVFTGSILAIGGTAGQLIPPVMGAAAFIMVDMAGISYPTIMLAAIIPSFIFLAAMYFLVDMYSKKNGLQKPQINVDDCRRAIISHIHLLLSVVVLVVLIIRGGSMMRCCTYATIALILLCMICSDTRPQPL